MTPDPRFAWHFCAISDTGPILRDSRPVVIGEWLRHDGEARICESGLHASYSPRDAIKYAPGAYATYCEVDGVVEKHDDKFVCTARRPVFGFDATEPLRLFARHQALSVAHLWKMPDVVRQWLETGEESIRSAAESAAWSAAWSAAELAAWAAAKLAARSAAESAAWSAAWSAAELAAWAAADEDLELLLFAYAEHLGVLPEALP